MKKARSLLIRISLFVLILIPVGGFYVVGTLFLRCGDLPCDFGSAESLVVNSQGEIYLIRNYFSGISKLDYNGHYISDIPLDEKSYNQHYGIPGYMILDTKGNIYYTERGNSSHQIFKIDPNGNLLTKWGRRGTADGEFEYPGALALDNQGNVYVLETDKRRIQKFDPYGAFLTRMGEYGNLDFQYESFSGITIDQRNIYISDNEHNSVLKFNPQGILLAELGNPGQGDGQFDGPKGLTTDTNGYLYVADSGNNRIQKFDLNGKFIAKWGSKGSSKGQFEQPSYITVDAQNNLYVIDEGTKRFQKFDSNGQLLLESQSSDWEKPFEPVWLGWLLTFVALAFVITFYILGVFLILLIFKLLFNIGFKWRGVTTPLSDYQCLVGLSPLLIIYGWIWLFNTPNQPWAYIGLGIFIIAILSSWTWLFIETRKRLRTRRA